MSKLIDPNVKCIIHCHFYGSDSPDEGPQVYFGTLEELRSTIATTWSKIPHRVVMVDYTIQVRKKGDDALLANFTFSNVTRLELPDHF